MSTTTLSNYRAQNKTTTCAVDGAENYKKCFRIFGAENIGENMNPGASEGQSEEDDEDMDFINLGEMLDAADEIEDTGEIELPKRIRCFVHLLALIMKINFGGKPANVEFWRTRGNYKRIHHKFFALANKLWSKQNQSTQEADKVRNIIGGLFVTPNETRWNALLDSCQKLYEHKDELNTVCDALGLRQFTPDELVFLEEYVKIAGPIGEVLDKLQGESSKVSLGKYILPMIFPNLHLYKLNWCTIICTNLSMENNCARVSKY